MYNYQVVIGEKHPIQNGNSLVKSINIEKTPILANTFVGALLVDNKITQTFGIVNGMMNLNKMNYSDDAEIAMGYLDSNTGELKLLFNKKVDSTYEISVNYEYEVQDATPLTIKEINHVENEEIFIYGDDCSSQFHCWLRNKPILNDSITGTISKSLVNEWIKIQSFAGGNWLAFENDDIEYNPYVTSYSMNLETGEFVLKFNRCFENLIRILVSYEYESIKELPNPKFIKEIISFEKMFNDEK